MPRPVGVSARASRRRQEEKAEYLCGRDVVEGRNGFPALGVFAECLLKASHAIKNRREKIQQEPDAAGIVMEFAFWTVAVLVKRFKQIDNRPEKLCSLHV
jgi:hypothetical protein